MCRDSRRCNTWKTPGAHGASVPASPTRASRTRAADFPAAKCCAKWPPPSPIVRSATAAPSAAASLTPIRRRIGRLRLPRLARQSIFAVRRDGVCWSRASSRAPSPPRLPQTRSSKRSTSPSCRAPDGMVSTNSVAKRASSPKRARQPCSIRKPAPRAFSSDRCAAYLSRSPPWRSRWHNTAKARSQRRP